MQTSDKPTLIPLPFANSGTKNTIPTAASPTPGLASLDTGFPPVTMTPIAAGGIPPQGADFNGIFNLISAISRWANAGAGYQYDPSFAAAVSGYPRGALLLKDSLDGYWLSTAEGNATDPDAGGAGWLDAFSGRLINARFLTATGIYNATTGTGAVLVLGVGAGSAGGGASATSSTQSSSGGGGGAGSWALGYYTSGFSGVLVTCGAGGTGVAGASGGQGSNSSFGSLMTLPPGAVGAVGAPVAANTAGLSGFAAGYSNPPTGSFLIGVRGSGGGNGMIFSGGSQCGPGGNSLFGTGGYASGAVGAIAAAGFGAGGSGALNGISSAARAGGNATPGAFLVLELSK